MNSISEETVRKLCGDAYKEGVLMAEYESVRYNKKRYKGKVPLDQQAYIESQVAELKDRLCKPDHLTVSILCDLIDVVTSDADLVEYNYNRKRKLIEKFLYGFGDKKSTLP